MKYVGYYNGQFGALEDIRIPVLDRSVYFGDGCYDATSFANNCIFAVEEHLERFYNSCRLLGIDFEMSREDLTDALQKCIDLNELDHGMLYWQASRATGYRAHRFPAGASPNLMIYTSPMEMAPLGVRYKLITVEDRRFYFCNIKTLNLIPSVLAAEQAERAGCDEVIFHRGERVTEGAHSNILIVKDGILIAPPTDELILPGITMKHLLRLADENKVATQIRPFTLEETIHADEIIVSSSGALLSVASEIDGKKVGGRGEDTIKTLAEAYKEYYNRYTDSKTFI